MFIIVYRFSWTVMFSTGGLLSSTHAAVNVLKNIFTFTFDYNNICKFTPILKLTVQNWSTVHTFAMLLIV